MPQVTVAEDRNHEGSQRMKPWQGIVIGLVVTTGGMAAQAEKNTSSAEAERIAQAWINDTQIQGGTSLNQVEPPAEPGAAVPEMSVEYQLIASEAEAMRLCEGFLDQIMAGEYQAAFDFIKPHFPVSPQRFDRLLQATRKEHGLATLQFGRPLGRVFINTTTIKDTVMRYRFLEKFEWDVMYWEFVFYRPDRGWILNGVGFDDAIQGLFE